MLRLGLHYSNRLEELVAPLAHEIDARQRTEPLARVTVVVPNRAVAEFLKLRIAEQTGVAANIDFPFLRAYLARVVSDAEPGLRVLEADELQIAVFECLRRELREPAFEPVRGYVAGLASVAEQELRLFQLSARVARLFREYSILRPAMLALWRKGKAVASGGFEETERWQRALYIALFDSDAALGRDWVETADVRWMLLPDAFAASRSERLAGVLPNPLHVFGLSYAGPEFVRIFGRIAQLVELHIHALNPCGEFWEDIQSLAGATVRSLPRRGEKFGGALDKAEDPFGLAAGGDNRALQLWGRPGREYFRLLNELTECDFDARFVDPAGGGGAPTILASLQSSILGRKPDPEPRAEGEGAPDDASIRFLACPGIRREVEIAANAICLMMRENDESPGARRLRFHHIALVAPDSEFDAYLPHIETVLAEQYRIPVNLAGARANAQSRVGEAVELLLKLPGGRFAREEVLHLLTHPAISGTDASADPVQWQAWCRSLGIFFGADARDFDGPYPPRDLFHWDQALKRLALGVFMAGAPSGVAETFHGPEGCEYLPYETPEEGAPAVASLLKLARGLLSDAIRIRDARLRPAQWAAAMADFVGTYVRPADAEGERTLDNCLAALASLDCAELRTGDIPYQVARELALSRIAEASQQGRYAEHGVAAGPLSALGSIPMRAVFVLGLGESTFPERDRRDPIDLRLAMRRAGDVSAAERDRYLFLQALLSARERIFLSWVSRDAQTGEKLEPSPLVRELQFIVRGWVDESTLANTMTVEHPVSRYDLRYFPDLAPESLERHQEMVSFDPEARRGARMRAARGALRKRFEGAVLPGRDDPVIRKLGDDTRQILAGTLRMVAPPEPVHQNDDREIALPIGALKRFLECPLQGAARYALGIVEEDDGGDEEGEDEPLVATILARTMLLREAFWSGRGAPDTVREEYRRAFRMRQLLGEAPAGPFAEAAEQADREKLDLYGRQISAAGIESLERWQQIRIGGATQFADIERSVDALVLDVGAAGAAGTVARRVRIQGIVGPVSAELDRSIRCIAAKKARARNFLDGFLGALVLAAAGERVAHDFTAIVLGGDQDGEAATKLIRRLRVPSREDARRYLRSLVEDLLSGNNHYFLPIEAVERVVKPKRNDPGKASEIVNKLRDEDNSCRSDYGPVREARRFDPPGDAEIDRIVERRFRPIEGIFGD